MLDLGLLVTALSLLISTALRCFLGRGNWENGAFFLCLIGTFFLLRSFGRVQQYYLNLFLLSALLVELDVAKKWLTGMPGFLGAEVILMQPEGTASFLLLACCAGAVLYCQEEGGFGNVFICLWRFWAFFSCFCRAIWRRSVWQAFCCYGYRWSFRRRRRW